ncbi:MAG: hypothetical protein J5671_01375 [Bacteroidaceae bacterium]|nr:hypothetical protein [Bacteroidaceae bacterium]
MNKIKTYIGAAVLGATVLAIPSCSDTWDDHYGVGDNNTAATASTLWDLIEDDPNLSYFKEIAEASTFYRDEEHPQNNYTFKDMLQGSMLTTVWIPTNDAFTPADTTKWMTYAREKGYTVQQQLLANSIALWRQVAIGGGSLVDTVTMLNGKKMTFDKVNLTMQGVNMDPQHKNITASNGTLHYVDAPLPFKYNLYEFLKDNDNATANSMTKFHDYIISNDTTYFSQDLSIEGTPDINGNPTYVDSVYVTTNKLFFGNHSFPTDNNTDQYLTFDESFGESIEDEDSTYILLMPTDAAWDNAISDLKSLYKYAPAYADNQKINAGTNNANPRLINDVDSFQLKNITMDITSPLCFNLHFQPDAVGKRGKWKLDDFLSDQGARAKYLLNSFGDTLRSDANWNQSTLFDGTQLSVSNGVGIVKTEWNIPSKLYKPDVYVEASRHTMYKPIESQIGTMKTYSYTYDVVKPWLSKTGRLFNDDFICLSPDQATSAPRFEFKLEGTNGENVESEVMSGKYDIYVVMVPNFYMTSATSDKIVHNIGDDGSAKIIENDTVPVKHKIRATITYCNGNLQGREGTMKSDLVEYTGEKVDTLLLFKDFEFPYSYKNLRFSYPSIQITTDHKSADLRNEYTNYICIDRFILRSKED